MRKQTLPNKKSGLFFFNVKVCLCWVYTASVYGLALILASAAYYLQGKGQGARSGLQPSALPGELTARSCQRCTPWCTYEVAHLQLLLRKGNRKVLHDLSNISSCKSIVILQPDKISAGPAAVTGYMLQARHKRGIFPAWPIQVHHSETMRAIQLWGDILYSSISNDFLKLIKWR